MSNHLTVVESDTVVISMKRASMALAEAVTISQTKKIMDVAAAAEIYAKRQHLSEEAEQMAATVKVEALRKLGEMLRATERAPSAKGTGSNQHAKKEVEFRNGTPPTLSELGLTKKESAVAQKLAALPEKSFQQVRDGHVTVAKAIAAVDATKKPAPAAAPVPVVAAPSAPADDFGPDAEEVAASQQALDDELATLRRIADADDKLAEALAMIKQKDAMVSKLSFQINSLTNQLASMTKTAKYWQRKAEKAVA